ncbi:MAG TPA: tripartite tricarboxylate transporter substrate binding protein [Burkholderiales bacterium]|nr:tripartite tricarboxylate transporter substrate binding protein [Burkholderiales bacterium]
MSVLTASLLAAAIVASSPVRAAGVDGYPSKPVRMIVPLAPGGGSDIVARIVAQALAAQWNQSVVVDNRPGAGSTIGTTIAARATPDGYTLLETSSSFVIGAALYRKLSYDVVKDFHAISLLASQPSIIAVNQGVDAKSLKQLVALMQAEPGKLGFGSAGRGTASHLANELFLMSAGVKATHVPYKSAGLASTALLGGEIQFMVTNMATAVPLVRGGKLRGLAVTSSRRAPSVADIPTAAEAGIPGYEYVTWYGLLAPASTPRTIISKVHGDVTKLLSSPEVRQRFAARGLDARPTTPEEFSAYVKSELAKWHGVVEAAGLEIQ